jgi:hypothetical protein
MEYKTVEFWEDILKQFLDPDAYILCNILKFKDKVWDKEYEKEWFKSKAKQFVSTKDYEIVLGQIYLFAGLHCFEKDIRIEFLEWLINDLKTLDNVQEV